MVACHSREAGIDTMMCSGLHLISLHSFASYRNFLPSMEEFFEGAIEQADPEAMIEDSYK